jgi:hypothetical protein
MNIWIARAKQYGSGKVKRVVEYYFANNIAGIGWRLDYEFHTMEEYLVKIKNVDFWIAQSRAIESACNYYTQMKKGDLIIATDDVIYYVGEVLDEEPTYAKEDDIDMAKEYNISWYRKVHWYKIGKREETPAEIVSKLSANWKKTSIAVRYENESNKKLYEYARLVFSQLSGKTVQGLSKPARIGENELPDILSNEELVDLVGLYLQDTLGYIFYPSSANRTSFENEYLLLDKKNKKKIYMQVRQTEKIDVSKYIKQDFAKNEIFLFSNKGYVNDENLEDVSNIHMISKSELFEYFKENIDLFYERIQYDLLLHPID